MITKNLPQLSCFVVLRDEFGERISCPACQFAAVKAGKGHEHCSNNLRLSLEDMILGIRYSLCYVNFVVYNLSTSDSLYRTGNDEYNPLQLHHKK